MGLIMFIIGFSLSVFYVYLLMVNVSKEHKKKRQDNYPGHSDIGDNSDYDGMGNFKKRNK